MPLGETVCIFTRTEIGRNDCDEPEYEWESETVSNVLVRPLTIENSGDLESLRPDGISIKYRLGIPKTYTKDLVHARIALIERGMSETDHSKALVVHGKPDFLKPCPTKWNRLADVGYIDG